MVNIPFPFTGSKEISMQLQVDFQKKYKQSEKGKVTQRKYYTSLAKQLANKRWNDKNKHKKRAHGQLRHAIEMGRVIKEACKICGALKVEGHHEDYDKPYDVIWFCHLHHSYHHRGLN